jgi:poly(A) polymerase
MSDLTPHSPKSRPLVWSDLIFDLQERLAYVESQTPLYLVGGAVRDALLHRPVYDLDFVTPTNSISLARKISNFFDGEIFVMDVERGVARVFIQTNEGKLTLDITQFRGADLREDLLERDFTVNAIAVDFHGDIEQLIDPLNGEDDLLNKVLRRCTSQSLTNDPLRGLRAVRQSVQLGLRIEPTTLADIRAVVPSLVDISAERLRDEFMKLLGLPKVSTALRVADALGLLSVIIPDIQKLYKQEQAPPHVFDMWNHTLYTVDKTDTIITSISPRRTDNTAAMFDMGMLTIQLDRYRAKLHQHMEEHWANDRSNRSLLVLASLLHHIPTDKIDKLADHYADALRLSNPEKRRLRVALGYYSQVVNTQSYDVLSAHRFWYATAEAGIDAILLGLAHYLGIYGAELQQEAWLQKVEWAIQMLSAYYDLYDTIVNPPMLINGNDLEEVLKLPPGRIYSKLLTALREAQVLGQIHTREEAFVFAQNYTKDT